MELPRVLPGRGRPPVEILKHGSSLAARRVRAKRVGVRRNIAEPERTPFLRRRRGWQL